MHSSTHCIISNAVTFLIHLSKTDVMVYVKRVFGSKGLSDKDFINYMKVDDDSNRVRCS